MILGVILLIIAAVIGFNYLKFQNSDEPDKTFIAPRLEYNAFVFKTIRSDYVTMDMVADLDNPMPIGFSIDSLYYEFYIEDALVFKSTYKNPVDFDAGDTSRVVIPITMYNDPLNRVLDSLKITDADSATYRVKGNFYADFPIINDKKITYDREIKAPAYKIPLTKVVDWDFQEIKKGDIIVNFRLMIVNFNVFPYNFRDLTYEIDLADEKMVLEGEVPGNIDIGAMDTAYITLPAKLDLGQFAGAAWEFIKKGDHITYDFHSKLYITSESNTIDDSPTELFAQGTLDELREATSDN